MTFKDFAFFDIYVDENKLPILKTIEVIKKNCLKVPPVIYKGPIKIFLAKFTRDGANFSVTFT